MVEICKYLCVDAVNMHSKNKRIKYMYFFERQSYAGVLLSWIKDFFMSMAMWILACETFHAIGNTKQKKGILCCCFECVKTSWI